MVMMKGCSTQGCTALATPKSAVIVARGTVVMLACPQHIRPTDKRLS